MVLPFVLVFMLLLVNNREIMGEFVKGTMYNCRRVVDDGDHGRADDCLVLDFALGDWTSKKFL